MSSLQHTLVTWADYLRLPERPETGKRYELHDGEVVIVPPPRPIHIKVQKRIETLLEALAGDRGVVTMEYPYRPVINLQFWFADVAYVLQADWDSMPPDDYRVSAPVLIVEVLSPSNTAAKINRQRIIAMSAGTQEFWVVDADRQTVQVTTLSGANSYGSGDAIPLPMFGAALPIDRIFA